MGQLPRRPRGGGGHRRGGRTGISGPERFPSRGSALGFFLSRRKGWGAERDTVGSAIATQTLSPSLQALGSLACVWH